jgi:hypothetical protein
MLYNFVLFCLTCTGTTFILAFGKLFDPIRPRNKFFKCPLCIGFWVGLFWYSYFHAFKVFLMEDSLLGFAIFPFISSIVCYWGANLIEEK